MTTDRPLPSRGRRRCLLCNRLFEPHPKVRTRQRVCSDLVCQRLRQKLNHLDWLERNAVDYARWSQDDGKRPSEAQPPEEQPRRRPKHRKRTGRRGCAEVRLCYEVLLRVYRAAKKEQLTDEKTTMRQPKRAAGEEELTPSFYLIKATQFELVRLHLPQKEELSYEFS